MKNYTLKIHDIKKETKDAITLCFKQPGLKKIKYLAGQYLSISFRINGRKYTRPYSFSSSPSFDNLLETTIKRIPNGVFSNFVHDSLQIGDMVEVMEPMGDFIHIGDESFKEIYFWGVGSGITPLISIIKEVLLSNPMVQVNLIYGNKNFESTIFSDLINDLLKNYSKNFRVYHFHTQYKYTDKQHFVRRGRITGDVVLELLKGIEVNQTKHYICGPYELKKTIKKSLEFLNCPSENVFSEDFELIRNPKDFDGIITQSVNIHYQGVEYLIKVEKGKSILEAALDNGLDLPYSCQTGSCNTCKGKLVKGELRMLGLEKERRDLNKDEFLLCCSHPLTVGIAIEM